MRAWFDLLGMRDQIEGRGLRARDELPGTPDRAPPDRRKNGLGRCVLHPPSVGATRPPRTAERTAWVGALLLCHAIHEITLVMLEVIHLVRTPT